MALQNAGETFTPRKFGDFSRVWGKPANWGASRWSGQSPNADETDPCCFRPNELDDESADPMGATDSKSNSFNQAPHNMSNVFNWQLGREMDYPYEAAYPDQQFAFVFNINRCIGCQSCTMACKSTWTFSKGQEYMWWNNVETKPYGGYPQFWDVKMLDLLEQANPGGQNWTGIAARM